MLNDSLFELRPNDAGLGRRKKPATLAASVAVHVLIAVTLILIPTLQSQGGPPVALPPPPTAAGPKSPVRFVRLAGSAAAGRASARSVSPRQPDVMTTPTRIPDEIPYIKDAIEIGSMDALYPGRPGPGGGGSSAWPGGEGGIGLPFGVPAPTAAAPPEPPPTPTPPPVPKFQPREPMRIASSLQRSLLIHQVNPVFPDLARRARIEGTVVVEALISKSGDIDSLRIISGNPLFNQAVIDAVKQWRYQPTILNGEPIDVITTITVNFTLN